MDDPGIYRVTVAVADPDGQAGEASFDLEVESSGGFNYFLLIPVALIGLVIGALLVRRYRTMAEPNRSEP